MCSQSSIGSCPVDAAAAELRGVQAALAAVRRVRGGRGRAEPLRRDRGRLADGRSVDYAVPADALIGRMTTDGYLVKARVAAGARDADDALYLLTRTRDRDEERRYAARRDFAVEPR